MGLAVDPERNMIYVTNELSGTISAINGTTNNLTSVIRFAITPYKSGYIQCNEKRLQQNFTRYDVGTDLSCEAIPYSGYAFSSWSGDLVPATFSRDPNINSKASIGFKVSKYGSLNANFITSNPLIPEQFWAPLYGIIPAVIASTLIPSIIQWNRGKKLSKRHLDYYSNLIGKTDLCELEKEIAKLYREGKINDSDYGILKDRINNFQDHHEDKPAGIHTGSPFS
jgi:YVTN family beta-propeller protein